jgi:hypothetical protein
MKKEKMKKEKKKEKAEDSGSTISKTLVPTYKCREHHNQKDHRHLHNSENHKYQLLFLYLVTGHGNTAGLPFEFFSFLLLIII